MGTKGPTPGCDLPDGPPDQAAAQPGSDEADPAELDPWTLASDLGRLLPSFPAAESVVLKLNRLLYGLLRSEVLPLADQAAISGVDPSPLLIIVARPPTALRRRLGASARLRTLNNTTCRSQSEAGASCTSSCPR